MKKIEQQKQDVGRRMFSQWKPMVEKEKKLKGSSQVKSYDRHIAKDFKAKGRESLNSPKRGRDNDVALGKNEQEKN